jgi:hypothetical protein
LFDYPLRSDEITRYLPREAATVAEVKECLRGPGLAGEHLSEVDGYYCLRGAEHTVALRAERERTSNAVWRRARIVAHLLALWPYSRMVAATGSLAANNCRGHDDIDLFVVTARGRVWITRLVVEWMARLPLPFAPCPNFVVSEDAMELVHRDFYAARELAQMVPVFAPDMHARFVALNAWSAEYLPNAREPRPQRAVADGKLRSAFRRATAWLGDRCGAARLDAWQKRKLVERARSGGWLEAPRVIMDEHQCKAHAIDYPTLLLERFRSALAERGLVPESDEPPVAATSR